MAKRRRWMALFGALMLAAACVGVELEYGAVRLELHWPGNIPRSVRDFDTGNVLCSTLLLLYSLGKTAAPVLLIIVALGPLERNKTLIMLPAGVKLLANLAYLVDCSMEYGGLHFELWLLELDFIGFVIFVVEALTAFGVIKKRLPLASLALLGGAASPFLSSLPYITGRAGTASLSPSIYLTFWYCALIIYALSLKKTPHGATL